MRTLFLIAALLAFHLNAGAAPLSQAAQPLVDYDFGATEAVWKPDGSELALQDENGIAIRDGQTLALKRYFRVKRERGRWLRLRAWNGDDLFLQSGAYFSNRRRVEAAPAMLLSARTGKVKAIWEAVNFSADGGTLWFHQGAKFRVLSLKTRRWFDINLPLRTQRTEDRTWNANVTFAPNGRSAAEQLADGRMRLWDVRARKVTATLSDKVMAGAYPQAMVPVVWSPNGKLVATLGEDPSHQDIIFEQGPNDGTINEHPPVVKIWDAQSGKLLQWSDSLNAPANLFWLDNARLLIGGSSTYRGGVGLEVRRVGSKQSWQIKGTAPVAPAPAGTRVFAGDQLLRLESGQRVRVVKTLFPAPPPLKDVAWSHDGRYVAATYQGQDRKHQDLNGVEVWNASSFELENAGYAHAPRSVGWTYSGRVWSSDLYRISSWDARDNWKKSDWLAPFIGKPAMPEANLPPANGLFLLPDGQRILQLDDSFDRALYQRTGQNAAPQLLFKNAQSGGADEVLSPDGKWLCFVGELKSDPTAWGLRAYETRLGGRSFEIANPAPDLRDSRGGYRRDSTPRFSPDSQFLSWGFRVYAWPSLRVIADTSSIEGDTLALAPGGQKLLRATPDGVGLFDVAGQKLATLSLDASPIREARFSPDGTRVALARERYLEIYDVRDARLSGRLYAWPQRRPQNDTNWLSLRANGPDRGTPVARALVVAAPK